MREHGPKASNNGIILTVEHPRAGVKRVSTEDGAEIAVFIAEPNEEGAKVSVMMACSDRLVKEIVKVLFNNHPEIVLPTLMVETLGAARGHEAAPAESEPLTIDRLLKMP